MQVRSDCRRRQMISMMILCSSGFKRKLFANLNVYLKLALLREAFVAQLAQVRLDSVCWMFAGLMPATIKMWIDVNSQVPINMSSMTLTCASSAIKSRGVYRILPLSAHQSGVRGKAENIRNFKTICKTMIQFLNDFKINKNFHEWFSLIVSRSLVHASLLIHNTYTRRNSATKPGNISVSVEVFILPISFVPFFYLFIF